MDLHIKDVLKKFTGQKQIRQGLYNQKIMEYWKTEMSPSIRTRTKSLFFKDGTLTIALDSASLKNEMFLNRKRIESLLNDYLGESVITKVVIR